DRGSDARTVVVDADRPRIVELPQRVSRQVNFADAPRGQRGEIGRRVPTVVAGAYVDVIDVAQDAAAGPLRDSADEVPFWNRRVRKVQVRGRILEQDRPPQKRLDAFDVAADDVERFVGQRQWQQVGKIDAVDDTPGKMLGDESGFETLDDRSHARKMIRVDTL